MRVQAPHPHMNVRAAEIRNSLRHLLVKPKLPISIPDMDTAFWSSSIGVERPDYLNISCFTWNDLRYIILWEEAIGLSIQSDTDTAKCRGIFRVFRVYRIIGTHILGPFFQVLVFGCRGDTSTPLRVFSVLQRRGFCAPTDTRFLGCSGVGGHSGLLLKKRVFGWRPFKVEDAEAAETLNAGSRGRYRILISSDDRLYIRNRRSTEGEDCTHGENNCRAAWNCERTWIQKSPGPDTNVWWAQGQYGHGRTGQQLPRVAIPGGHDQTPPRLSQSVWGRRYRYLAVEDEI